VTLGVPKVACYNEPDDGERQALIYNCGVQSRSAASLIGCGRCAAQAGCCGSGVALGRQRGFSCRGGCTGLAGCSGSDSCSGSDGGKLERQGVSLGGGGPGGWHLAAGCLAAGCCGSEAGRLGRRKEVFTVAQRALRQVADNRSGCMLSTASGHHRRTFVVSTCHASMVL
jgi:hypothetical protein